MSDSLTPLPVVDRVRSADGATKYLFEVAGGRVEAIFLRHRSRDATCVSTQIGCSFSCSFCVTGTLGFGRNLEGAEIAAEVKTMIEREARRPGHDLFVAYMGMGEPLQNLSGVLASRASVLTDHPDARFRVSTVGVIPAIDELARKAPDVELQISVHASDTRLRTEIMGVNRRYPLADVLAAAERYARSTGSTVILNYVLLGGVNDTPDDAARLAGIVRSGPFTLQVVRLNPDSRLVHQPASTERASRFVEALETAGVVPHVSMQMGTEEGAGCGQLDADYRKRGEIRGGRRASTTATVDREENSI